MSSFVYISVIIVWRNAFIFLLLLYKINILLFFVWVKMIKLKIKKNMIIYVCSSFKKWGNNRENE